MTKKIACDVSEPLGWITARENSEPFEVTRPSLQSEPNLRNHCTAYERATVYDDTNEPERANNEDDSTRDKRASSADHGTTPKRANSENDLIDWERANVFRSGRQDERAYFIAVPLLQGKGAVYSVEWIYEETTSKWGPRRDSRDETLAHQAE